MSLTRKPAILHIGNFLSTSGHNQTFVEELADRFEGAGWAVIRTSQIHTRFRRVIDIATTCWSRRSDYDVAHITVLSGLAFVWAEIAALIVTAGGRPFVLSLHGGNLPSFARRWPRRVRRLLSSAAGVITPSTYLYEHMRGYREDMMVIPNPIDVGSYPKRILPKASPRLIWLRAFHEVYNPTLAVTVAHSLMKDHPDTELIMVGPDKGDGSLKRAKRISAELGVTKHLVMTGGVSRSEVPGLLQKADIFLNTTNIDNTPVSVIEAMACGLCIVSTNVGGIPYLLEHERTALLVPPNDPDAMTSAVQRILNEPELAHRLSSNAIRAAEQFDWELIFPKWDYLMRGLARKDGRTAASVAPSRQTA